MHPGEEPRVVGTVGETGLVVDAADVAVHRADPGGRGLGKPEGFKLCEELAEAFGPGSAVAATRAVVDLTNTWGDEPVPDWLDGDGSPGTARIAARWAAAGVRVPVVRAFSEISHHDLEDAGRATAPRRALAVGTERTDAAPEPAAEPAPAG